MKQWGIVKEIQGTKALVEVCGQGGCQRCGQCLGAQRPHMVWAANPPQAQIGERVCVHLSTRLALAGGFLLYILPLILMLAGYSIGSHFFQMQGAGLIGAALGFSLSLALGSVANRALERVGALELTIIKVERKKGGM
jgi:positive regulator of sigma E activity